MIQLFQSIQSSSKGLVSIIMSHNRAWPNSFIQTMEGGQKIVPHMRAHKKGLWTKNFLPIIFAACALPLKFAADILPQKLSHKDFATKICQLILNPKSFELNFFPIKLTLS